MLIEQDSKLIEQGAQKKFSHPKKKSWLNESNIFWDRKETKKNMPNFGIGSKKNGGLYYYVTFCITKEHVKEPNCSTHKLFSVNWSMQQQSNTEKKWRGVVSGGEEQIGRNWKWYASSPRQGGSKGGGGLAMDGETIGGFASGRVREEERSGKIT